MGWCDGYYHLVAALYMSNVFLDFADGISARYLKQCTILGQVLDTIFDHIAYGFMLTATYAACDSHMYRFYIWIQIMLKVGVHFYFMTSTAMISTASHKETGIGTHPLLTFFYDPWVLYTSVAMYTLFDAAQYLTCFIEGPKEYIVACESACKKLPWKEAQSLRAEVVGTLKSAKLPKSNITKEERVALCELKKSNDLLIMGADKGKCTVVQTKDNYEQKVNEMLSDQNTYEKLSKDPTPSFRGQIFRQIFGAAMGSPVSAIVANLVMEWLEKEAIMTAPLDCKPKYWRRYVDDVLEIIQKDTTLKLTEHLNTIDPTGSIKFTHEEEDQGKIPFLDTLIVRKEDGSVKMLVYRKKTHTDQYLNFKSQHPLHQKLGVIRTLMDRKENIVTEEVDKREEERKIKNALMECGYPKWAFDRVKHQMEAKTKEPKKPKKSDETPSKGMVVIPYVEGFSEQLQRIFQKHKISTAMRPTNTLKSILVHPKDKKDILETSDAVYEIPCKGCDKSYVGETGRQFGVRLKEHQQDSETVKDTKFTRAAYM
ncbi:uncharacterized protein [Amphiura filiformis]|uniref:uncharacterized protein n=1 Tax=Amphiura filiformis TaxID=82378 RepID=UPI003B21E3A0